jgi:hypothetical protein
MSQFRNLAEDATMEVYIDTIDSTGAPVAPSSAFVASDFAIYKNGSATAKATTNGITVVSPFNGEVGTHLLIIDTSNNTGDAGFWTTGGRYQAKFNTAKTVGGVSIDGRKLRDGAFGIQSEWVGSDLSTNVTAIKTKTDNLPSDPADASDIAAAFTALRGADGDTLKTLSDQIDGIGGGGGGSGDAEQATSEEILDAVTVHGQKLDRIEAKTAMISAARLRVTSRVDGLIITAKIGDDHLLAASNALLLSIPDEAGTLYTFLTTVSHEAVEFGAAQSGKRDEITAAIDVGEIYRDSSYTVIPIELTSVSTIAKKPGEYLFDIQVTTADGYLVTKPELQGTIILEHDAKS